MRSRYQTSRAFDRCKRAMDLIVAAVVLIPVMPLLAGCALWIKWVDGGSVLYRQWRVGRNGWLFRIYKLRTMRLDAEKKCGARFAQSNDPRILPGCGWMRKSHVDELPQLWNILLGHMSLVGPRPERPEIVEQLRPSLPNIEQRLVGVPGLTGLAQIRNGYSNDLKGTRRKLAYDLRYLRNRSLVSEMRLLLGTIPKIWDHAAM